MKKITSLFATFMMASTFLQGSQKNQHPAHIAHSVAWIQSAKKALKQANTAYLNLATEYNHLPKTQALMEYSLQSSIRISNSLYAVKVILSKVERSNGTSKTTRYMKNLTQRLCTQTIDLTNQIDSDHSALVPNSDDNHHG